MSQARSGYCYGLLWFCYGLFNTCFILIKMEQDLTKLGYSHCKKKGWDLLVHSVEAVLAIYKRHFVSRNLFMPTISREYESGQICEN